MITPLKIFVVFLLLLNGTGAIFGGGQLIAQPDGSTMDLSLNLLKHSPFKDYLIPGIFLFVANGLFSFCVIGIILFNIRHYSLFIVAQGIILTIWILAQVVIIDTITQLHLLLGAVGILLTISALILRKLDKNSEDEIESLAMNDR